MLGQDHQTLQSSTNKTKTNKNKFSFKLINISSNMFNLLILIMMITITSGLRFHTHQQSLTQKIRQLQNPGFQFRIYCPYSYLNTSFNIIDNKNISTQGKNTLKKNSYLSKLKVRDHPETFNYNSTYLIQVRSIKFIDNSNKQSIGLFYCGLTRGYYNTCQDDVKYDCASVAGSFQMWQYQPANVIFLNLMNPDVTPLIYQINQTSKTDDYLLRTCFNQTFNDSFCYLNQKVYPEEVFQNPVMEQVDAIQPMEKLMKKSIINFKVNPRNWPLTTHIHGGQNRPTMDGNPLGWVSNIGHRGPGSFSAQDQCYYSSFDNKNIHEKQKIDGNPPPVMIITDRNGKDITNQAKINRYPNAQTPGDLWYHDHAPGLTNYHLINGLSGTYILKSRQVQKVLKIPRQNQFLLYNSYSPIWNDLKQYNFKFRGGQVYRFRFLNYVPSGVYYISLTHKSCLIKDDSTKLSLTLIGTDLSMFDRGISNLKKITITPGQRIQFLVKMDDNFQNLYFCSEQIDGFYKQQIILNNKNQTSDNKKHYTMRVATKQNSTGLNDIPIPISPPRPANAPYKGRTSIDNVVLPIHYTDLSLISQKRIVQRKMRPINYLYRINNQIGISLRSNQMKGWVQKPQMGTIQDYFFINVSNMPHTIHFHIIAFQILKKLVLRDYIPSNTSKDQQFYESKRCAIYQVDQIAQVLKLIIKKQKHIKRQLKFVINKVFQYKFKVVNYQYICKNRKYFYNHETFIQYMNLIFPEYEVDKKTKVNGMDIFTKANIFDVLNYKNDFNLTLGGYKYITGQQNYVQPQFKRWKQGFLCDPSQVCQIRIRWTKNDYRQGLNPPDTLFTVPIDQMRQFPGYVYHVFDIDHFHSTGHRQFDTMRPFMLQLPKNVPPHQLIDKNTPCNYDYKKGKYNIDWVDKYKCINQRCKKKNQRKNV